MSDEQAAGPVGLRVQRPYLGVPAAAYTERMTGEAAPSAGDPAGSSRRLIEELVRAAVAAPSLYNAQPWRFRIWPVRGVIELAADPARMLAAADPDGRAAHIACGAALFNLRVAAAAAGLQPDIRVFPDPAQPLLLAQIRLTGRHRVTSWEEELKAAIPPAADQPEAIQ